MRVDRLRRSVMMAVILLASVTWGKTDAYAQFSKLSESDELKLGQQAALEVEKKYPVLQNASVQNTVNRIGQRLVRNSQRQIPYAFKVLDLPEVNAFALPGGYIYVQRGVLDLARNENEVAGVLAHEISHVVFRHSVDQLQRAQKTGLMLGVLDMVLGGRGTGGQIANLAGQMVGQGVFMKHSRDAERQADREGVVLMQRAGYDPHGMLTFLQRMEQQQGSQSNLTASWFASHPSLREREQNVADLIGNAPAETRRRRRSR